METRSDQRYVDEYTGCNSGFPTTCVKGEPGVRTKSPPFERMIAEALLHNTAIVSLHVDLDIKMLSEFFDNADCIFQSQLFSDATPGPIRQF